MSSVHGPALLLCRYALPERCATAALLLFAASVCQAYETPRNLQKGLDGNVQLGALATFGPTDSSAVTARATATFRSQRWEHEFDAKFYRSTSEALVARRDAQGEKVLDAQNREIQDLVKSTTNDRRFASMQLRRFVTSKHYVFGIADLDRNEPANLDSSTRQIAGIGYKLWRGKNDVLSAAIGYGRKKRIQVSGETEEGGIGYLGLRFKRAMSKKTTVRFDLDSDFGSDNRFSEAEVSLSWKLREPVSLTLKYEARFNSTVVDPLNTFDDGLEAALSINLAVDVF